MTNRPQRKRPAVNNWMAWEVQIASGTLAPGHYRFTLQLKGKSPNATLVNAMRGLFTTQLSSAGYKDISVSNFLPVPEASTPVGTWPIIVDFTVPETLPAKKKGLDPRGLFRIATTIVVTAFQMIIVGSNLILVPILETAERIIDKPFDLVKDTTGKIFNPGTVLLLVFAVFLIITVVPQLKGR